MEVHRQLGYDFLEVVYQEALALESAARGVPYRREVELPVCYKGQPLEQHLSNRFCLLRFSNCRTQGAGEAEWSRGGPGHQLFYPKVSDYEVGLLLNFGAGSLEYQRLVFSKSSPSP